jgi:hypothetical protein
MSSLESVVAVQDSGPCPSFFRACCYEAARANASGIRVGYDHPGYHLAMHVMGLCPYEVERDDWLTAIGKLESHLADEDDSMVLDWFCQWLPRCMALVPHRRRVNFVKGVYRGAADAGLYCDE